MRDKFLAHDQSALLALLFGDAAKTDNELDNLVQHSVGEGVCICVDLSR